jgi:hypothetical protein
LPVEPAHGAAVLAVDAVVDPELQDTVQEIIAKFHHPIALRHMPP